MPEELIEIHLTIPEVGAQEESSVGFENAS
jgi:hypothetical protein